MAEITPFADNSTSISIGDLTVENGTDCVALRGSLDLTHDKQGLLLALALKRMVDHIVDHLQSSKELPDAVAKTKPARPVLNPFQ